MILVLGKKSVTSFHQQCKYVQTTRYDLLCLYGIEAYASKQCSPTYRNAVHLLSIQLMFYVHLISYCCQESYRPNAYINVLIPRSSVRFIFASHLATNIRTAAHHTTLIHIISICDALHHKHSDHKHVFILNWTQVLSEAWNSVKSAPLVTNNLTLYHNYPDFKYFSCTPHLT